MINQFRYLNINELKYVFGNGYKSMKKLLIAYVPDR